MKSPEYTHHCRIDWQPNIDSITRWDNICVWVVENCGMPGDKYITDIDPDYMVFSFKDPRYAVLFKLKFGEVIV